MTLKQKNNERINRLWNRIKNSPLTDEQRRIINIRAFLYGCGRQNDLQIVVYLTKIALEQNINIQDVCDDLE